MTDREKILSEAYAEFIYPNSYPEATAIERYNAEVVQPIGIFYSTLYVPLSKTDSLNFQNYSYSFFPKLYGLMNTVPLDESGITRLRAQPALGLDGSGVIVGIIDTGIDYTNKIFLDDRGQTRIMRLWDQTASSGRLPAAFPDEIRYGAEYTAEDIDTALASDNPYSIVPERDENGHGTYLAGIAAGRDDINADFAGCAPNASIIAVKLKPAKKYLRDYYLVPDDAVCYQENDIIIAANYLRAYARIFNMPLVILIGLGSNQGGHIGTLPLESELNTITNAAGAAVIVAAGNEGNARHHYSGLINSSVYGSYKSDTIEINVGRRSDSFKGFTVETWVNIPQTFSVGITSPSGQVVPEIKPDISGQTRIEFIFENTIAYVDYSLIEATTGNQLIQLRFDNPAEGIWKINIFGNDVTTGAFDCYLPITQFVGNDVYFLKPDPDVTITSPGMAINVITVSGYNTANGSFYLNSGRGFSATGAIKPDIAAPAVAITGPSLLGGFSNESGTSAAVAITAGACALFLEWTKNNGRVNVTNTREVKSYLIRGAVRNNDENYPNRLWGYGKLDIYRAFEVLRQT